MTVTGGSTPVRAGPTRPVRAGADGGNASVLVVAIVAVALIVALSVLRESEGLLDDARAQTAADAAALAGAVDGRDGAVRLAGANGATVLHMESRRAAVRVTVRVGRGEARAAAGFTPD